MGPIPASLLNMPILNNLLLTKNFLSGVVPPFSWLLSQVPLCSTATFSPAAFPCVSSGLLACSSSHNCFSDSSRCRTDGVATQRSATECAICGGGIGVQQPCGAQGVCAPVVMTLQASTAQKAGVEVPRWQQPRRGRRWRNHPPGQQAPSMQEPEEPVQAQPVSSAQALHPHQLVQGQGLPLRVICRRRT
ncbi:hypothetical protein CLOP_g2368 [Closterium sp. NIES-67]|nr:hypothetical protein CLOP_g2368 [Closterium sp. NIES-67]